MIFRKFAQANVKVRTQLTRMGKTMLKNAGPGTCSNTVVFGITTASTHVIKVDREKTPTI